MKNSNLLNRLLSYSHEKQSPQRFGRYAVMLIMLLTLGVGQMWAKGYSNKTFVYLEVNGTTKYYEIATDTWPTDISLLGTWGGVLSSQSFNDIRSLKVVGGAIGGWTADKEYLSASLYYAVTNSSSTPASWTSFGSITANYIYKTSSDNCFSYKNDGSSDITLTPGTYYLHIKIEDEYSGSHTSNVAFTVHRYTVAGSEAVLGSDWDKDDTNNDMTFSGGSTYTLTKSNVALETGTTYSFKVIKDQDWNQAYPAQNKTFTVAENAHYNVTFTFDASNNEVSNPTITRLYSVTYNGNGNTGGSVSTTYHLNGASVTVAAQGTLDKSNYSFGGWNTANDGTGTNYTAGSGSFTMGSSDKTLYAKWTQGTTVDKNEGNANTTYTATWNKTSISIVSAPTRTGYTLNGYYAESGCSNKIAAANGTLQTSVTVSGTVWTSSGKWAHTPAAATIYAGWTANTYYVKFNANGGDDGEMSNQTLHYDASETLNECEFTRTGYTFAGWAESEGGSVAYADKETATFNLTSTQGATANLYAKWTAKGYTVTLNVDEDNKGTIVGATTSQDVTYDAATTTVPNRPTAANGYALDGYYTDQLGEGTKVINGDGTWIASVLGYTDEDAKWVHDGDVTLYAYYKKAEITNLVAAPGVIAPGETITITPTIEPTPTGTTKVCWEVQYSNGTPLPSQPTFTPGAGNAVSFPVPSASATYIIQATLAKGSSCPAAPGDVLSTRTTTFQVAGEHTVTIRYQDSEGRTLQASASIEARPLDWTTAGDITPPTITGYTFARWDAGDGVTIKNGDSDPVTTTTTSSIQIKATYDGTLTAVYAKKKLIFFNNTLGWSDVYVYFYNSDKYWNDAFGSGAQQTQAFDGDKKPYWEQEHGHMTNITGTNIWYFDYEEENYSTRANVAFTEGNQHTYQWFNYTNAVRREDHVSSLQMFVPLTTKTNDLNNTKYYNSGYWMNYPENTGYSLLIYNQKAKAGATKLYEFPFEFTEDFTMPMELVVDLEAGQTYGFEIKRADGTYYSNTGTMTANTTNWAMETDKSSYCGLQTTAAGNYTFKLYYSSSNYQMDVTYPVAVNDYRIVYTDLATWSKDAHTASWYHPSRVITKNNSATETKKDTVSFFWTYGSSPAIKYQTCSAVAAGSASWNAGIAISVSDFSSVLTKVGVYNFIFEQPAGGASIALVKVEPYTGKYYIRTDVAGSTKWSNYQSTDHEMTYSDYTEKNHGYSHYFPHWVDAGKNVKFCIANDYSPCITDTLTEDYGTTIANITTEGNAYAGTLNTYGANIRFMWNHSTNKIWRAYIGGSANIADRFLVLEGDAKMFDEDGNALTGIHRDHNKEGNVFLDQDNQVVLHDDENFVYEREIKVQTGARAKLTAKYNNNIQYFIGGASETIELLGGTASETKNKMRIVYDFKTNRLVTAYVPEGDITEALAINADIMLVREHQEAGQQLVFKGDGALSKVKTVYGVMRFNRWTLNNKETDGDHDPVGDPKSAYERGLYWISFPFNVNLSDVFGFGTYGTHWIIMEYDGAARATEGYWADSEGFWKYVTDRSNKVLEAGKGYVLALDLDLMKSDNTSFWTNNIEQVELFFPSAKEVENIEATNVTTTVDEHECTIDRTNNNGSDINKNRTRADSHWNIIGIPSYANYGSTLEDGSGNTITWNTEPYTNNLPFLYEWSTVDNSYAVQSGTTYPFKAMHAYMVQYHGDLYWSLASATPPSIVARSTYAEKPESVEMRIELQQNEMKVDQTFVKLSNDENASVNFAFDEDLCKEFNANKANIYTIVENYLPVAGNTMPMSEQTTVIPVGVRIAADGDYTFAIPDGTEGIGVTLIDNETGIRTSLSALEYTINLSAGDYADRFILEISPISQISTDVESISDEGLEIRGARKIMIDGLLYIVKDGVVYDAQGRRL